MSDCLFYVFAGLAVAAALFMVSSRGAVNGAVGMIAALVAVAADFFLLDAPFLGVLQILVYAGAVMVLFLFIIMLLDVDKASSVRRPASKWAVGIVVTVALTGAIVWGITHAGLPGNAAPSHPSPLATADGAIPAQPLAHAESAKAFGFGLFTKYMLPIQVAGFLLLSAMIGVVTLAKGHREAE